MKIVQHDILKALNDWGESLIAISRAYEDDGLESARAIAEQTLDRLYGFEFGPVLFKPTLSGGPQTFRLTKIGALSYFIGSDPEYPNDNGFGIKFWTVLVKRGQGLLALIGPARKANLLPGFNSPWPDPVKLYQTPFYRQKMTIGRGKML